jgi:hypothetical protein
MPREDVTAGLARREELGAKLYPKTSIQLRAIQGNEVRHKCFDVFGISTTDTLSVFAVFITAVIVT